MGRVLHRSIPFERFWFCETFTFGDEDGSSALRYGRTGRRPIMYVCRICMVFA